MPFLDLEGLQILWSNILSKLSDKVDKIPGKSLVEDSEISRIASVKTGLEIDLTEEDLEEGIYLVNADQLGGINAEEYATKEDLISVDLEGALEVNSAKASADLLGGSVAAEYTLETGVVTSVNDQTGAVNIPEIKYIDLSFSFDNDRLVSYATLPSSLSNVNQIINILSFTHQVFITKPWFDNGKLYVSAHSTDISGDGSEIYPYRLGYYNTNFTARVIYF